MRPFLTIFCKPGDGFHSDLGALFPSLSYPVVASLDRSDLDALYDAQERHEPKRLGDDATKDFVLLHVFEIAPALIRHSAELLRVLLRRHYRRQLVPRLLDDRLVHVLQQSGAFDSWPLETIVPDREAFFSFLQERWPLFLDRLAGKPTNRLEEVAGIPIFEIGGPPDPALRSRRRSRLYRQPVRRRDAAAGAPRGPPMPCPARGCLLGSRLIRSPIECAGSKA